MLLIWSETLSEGLFSGGFGSQSFNLSLNDTYQQFLFAIGKIELRWLFYFFLNCQQVLFCDWPLGKVRVEKVFFFFFKECIV